MSQLLAAAALSLMAANKANLGSRDKKPKTETNPDAFRPDVQKKAKKPQLRPKKLRDKKIRKNSR